MGDSIEGLDPKLGEDGEPKPPRDWNTIVTIVLMALLLGAGIAAAVMRHRGIEMQWPWSKPTPTAEPGGAQSP